MTNDKSSMSAMQQRFQAVRDEAPPSDAPVAPWFETELLAILRRPVGPGQARDGHMEKEREIGAVFARMSVAEAMALYKRLTFKLPGDVIVEAFARLIEERRARLLAFLGDARRRAALMSPTSPR